MALSPEDNLVAIAKEINARLDKAAKAEDTSYDHRLAAAIRLADAKVECFQANIPFREWCEANVRHKYETVRKLVQVGSSQDPAKAIEDMRGRNKKANKKLRSKVKVKKAVIQTPEMRIKEGFQALAEGDGLQEVMGRVAKECGMVALPRDEAEALQALGEAQTVGDIDHIKMIFEDLSSAGQMEVATWAAAQVGVALDGVLEEGPGELEFDV